MPPWRLDEPPSPKSALLGLRLPILYIIGKSPAPFPQQWPATHIATLCATARRLNTTGTQQVSVLAAHKHTQAHRHARTKCEGKAHNSITINTSAMHWYTM